MNFEKDNFNFGHFTGRIHTNFKFREEFLKNKKAKKHIRKLLNIAEVEIDKEIEKRYSNVKRTVKERIKHFRNIVND